MFVNIIYSGVKLWSKRSSALDVMCENERLPAEMGVLENKYSERSVLGMISWGIT